MAVARSAVAWLGLLALASSVCQGAEQRPSLDERRAEGAQGALVDFDIPPQSLVSALRAYSEATGIAVLVDDDQVEGRDSAGLHGRYRVADALNALLGGSGMVARYASHDAFTVAPASSVGRPPGEGRGVADDAGAAVDRTYASRVQHAVEMALCRSEHTRPGTYRLALSLWVDAAGRVERSDLLDTSGSADRDARISAALSQMNVGVPPASVSSPLVLLLLPRAPGDPFDCHSVRSDN
ncbi:hypothetical protein FHW69_002256 [Luteibacter sp. Sphag1AF]|uniref:STN domain-containing protein n=1 Tax=Luteibacter sp. Sphag1AF TaxID=2587031 RepID=UPI00161195B7|nr:STN domain-containing protein [Luteibacter sp. Sphag1AF]MBB3227633.1 hypothetical protein [Luteibacter sp. Sphag1AF]